MREARRPSFRRSCTQTQFFVTDSVLQLSWKPPSGTLISSFTFSSNGCRVRPTILVRARVSPVSSRCFFVLGFVLDGRVRTSRSDSYWAPRAQGLRTSRAWSCESASPCHQLEVRISLPPAVDACCGLLVLVSPLLRAATVRHVTRHATLLLRVLLVRSSFMVLHERPAMALHDLHDELHPFGSSFRSLGWPSPLLLPTPPSSSELSEASSAFSRNSSFARSTLPRAS